MCSATLRSAENNKMANWSCIIFGLNLIYNFQQQNGSVLFALHPLFPLTLFIIKYLENYIENAKFQRKCVQKL